MASERVIGDASIVYIYSLLYRLGGSKQVPAEKVIIYIYISIWIPRDKTLQDFFLLFERTNDSIELCQSQSRPVALLATPSERAFYQHHMRVLHGEVLID